MNGTCPSCGSATEPAARHCVRCGTALIAASPISGSGTPLVSPFLPVPWVAPARPRSSGLGVAALVLGIGSFVLWIVGFALAPTAIGLGAAGIRRARDDPARWSEGTAVAGLVLGLAWMGIATLIVGGLVLGRLLAR